MKTSATVIPCIDLMGGKVVQLVRGEKIALEKEPEQAVAMFTGFPLLHIIDLDAALGRGNNRELISWLLQRIRARVGGGIRSVEVAVAVIQEGAEQVIIGSSAFTSNGVNEVLLKELQVELSRERIIVAIDVKHGRIAVQGWQETLDMSPFDVMDRLEPFCAGYLCTNVDREGMLQGTDLDLFLRLRAKTEGTLIAAGGITTMDEVRTLIDAGVDAALGMSVYTGKLSLQKLSRLSERPL